MTTEVDLEILATEVADRYGHLGAKTVTVSGRGSRVMGRRSQLERALGNLVENATRWAATRVELVLQGSAVKVRDDGPGIPEKNLSHVFRHFYRSEEARTTPGSGLGLAIVEHLVKAHGGTVSARNVPDGGAEVGFDLPRGGAETPRRHNG